MPWKACAAVTFVLLAALAPPAGASNPPGEPGGDPGDGNPHHVHRLRPWRAKFEYQMQREAIAHDEQGPRDAAGRP
jgi:hypothetical protein